MIVVSVGTNEARFDRLLEWIAALRLEEETVVQHGGSHIRPAGASCIDFLPYEDLVALVRRSRVFVTHAGVGSIIVGLTSGRRPLVVPRLKRYGEAVDDHQVALASRLQDEGLVTLVTEADELARAIASREHQIGRAVGATALQRELHGYLHDLLASHHG